MRQPTVMDYFNKMEIQESNGETKEIIKDKVINEDVKIPNTKESINDSNGIVEVKYGNEIYKTWKVEFIRPFIYRYLKERYPDSLIVREISKIDITVFDNLSNNRIPVEIQKTPLSVTKTFSHIVFEQSIRTQIEINIKTYSLCWFFFDSEYLRYLQSGNIGKATSINMTWIINLMRENTLRVFTIKYNGDVRELTTKDFDFLKDISQTCSIGEDSVERILIKNKLEIYYNVIKGYNFTQEEITQFENDFDNRNDDKYNDSCEYFTSSNNIRCKLYGNIMLATHSLLNINKHLSCTIEDKPKRTVYCVILGLFYQNDFYGGNKNARIQFTDKFGIAKYFPGYLRNKEMWDYCKSKQRSFSINEFNGIITGTFNYEFIKKQSTMEDY